MSLHNIDTHKMPTLTLCTKKDVLFYSISKYYDKHPDYIEEIISPIVDGSHQLSLRFIEKFITKYCKEKKIIIQDCNGKYVDIYNDYKNNLTSFEKEYFDLFKRNHHKIWEYQNNKYVYSTLGQLNIFRWIIISGIYDYMIKNYSELSKEI